jgi:hypothetical protein
VRPVILRLRRREIRVSPLPARTIVGGWRSAWRVELGGESREVWLEVRPPGTPLDAAALEPWASDASTILGLPLAMATGLALRAPPLRSRRLAASLPRLQATYTSMFPELKQVPLRAGRRPGPPLPALAPRRASALFFSGGIDSFHSLLSHRDETGLLIAVRGFDVGAKDDALWSQVRQHVAAVAAETACGLVEVTTGVRRLLRDHVSWEMSHGAVMAWIATLIAPLASRVRIASSYRHGAIPWGSHPDLDPLWSSEALEIEHDGAEHSRARKAEDLAREPLALRHLRVCWQNRGGPYNCGVCRKCTTTRVLLHAVGALDRCATLHGVPTPEEIDRLPAERPTTRLYLDEALEAYRRLRPDALQREALERRLARAAPAPA